MTTTTMKFSELIWLPEWLVSYLTGDYPYSPELQAFWMALQGAMSVRTGPNKDRSLHWFHAFMLTVVTGYGGACFTPQWMGNPTSMLSNDLNLAGCIIAFVIVNCMPYDLGFKLARTLPVTLVITTFAQLFRSLGVVKYTSIAYHAFKDSPSAYYPVPVFGPIAFGTLLGNMGGFFAKGFNGYLANGMPWPFQNGLFCCTLYHFFVHDHQGPIGAAFRRAVHSVPFLMGGLDDQTFAVVMVGLFMQICGLLQLPQFLGPGFSPFHALYELPGHLLQRLPKAEVDLVPVGAPKAEYAVVKMTNVNGTSAATVVRQLPEEESQAAKQKTRARRRNKKKEL